jgi:autotransporter adhesin
VSPGKTFAIGGATANYEGYQAAAIGFSARITTNLKLKGGASFGTGGGVAVGIGASYEW